MSPNEVSPTRFIGLDVHKHYLVAAGVDRDQNEVLAPRRVPLTQLERWVQQHLTHQDAVVLEMSTNSFQLYDDLVEHVHSVTLVHPPHVALITQAQVKVDRQAARKLAKLHAAKLPSGYPAPSSAMYAPWSPNAPRWSGWPPRPRTACTPCCIGGDWAYLTRAACSAPKIGRGGWTCPCRPWKRCGSNPI
jgi:hypothetical protein